MDFTNDNVVLLTNLLFGIYVKPFLIYVMMIDKHIIVIC
jgi:hypothetical protein